jgi:peptide/nickel transport system permease protein
MISGARTYEEAARLPVRPGLGRRVWWFIRRKPLGAFGAGIVLLLLFTAAFAPVLAPYSYEQGDAARRLKPPSLEHPLGTDANGRDMLSRVIWGARVSVTVGFGSVFIAMSLATLIGTVSGYFGGRLDTLVQRLVDIWMAFPALVLLISLLSVLGPGLWNVVITLGVLLAAGASRVVRGAALSVRNNLYIEAARCVGCTDGRILLFYVLPNVFPVVIVLATVQLGGAILAESTISFLGYGVPPPHPAWGAMLGGIGRAYMHQAPWLVLWPGLAISFTVFGFNMLGDALRDVLDPRLRGR